MNAPIRPGQPHARTDPTVLAAGNETGWWDDNGRPAPWPDDFLDPNAEWTNGKSSTPADYGDENDPENRPF